MDNADREILPIDAPQQIRLDVDLLHAIVAKRVFDRRCQHWQDRCGPPIGLDRTDTNEIANLADKGNGGVEIAPDFLGLSADG